MADVKRIRKLWLNHHVINSEKDQKHSEKKSARIKHVLNDALYRSTKEEKQGKSGLRVESLELE